MTIEYDAERKRATHVESGMAVEFDREGPHLQERDFFFRLTWKGKTSPFKATYDFGSAKVERLYPNLSIMEQRQKREELNEQNFHVSSLPVDVRVILRTEMPDFGQVFVELLREVISHFETSKRKSAYFSPFFDISEGEWSAEG